MSLPGFTLGGVLGSRSLQQRSLKRERVRRLCSDCCGGGGGLNNFGRGRGDGDEDFGGDEVFLLPAVVPLEPEEKVHQPSSRECEVIGILRDRDWRKVLSIDLGDKRRRLGSTRACYILCFWQDEIPVWRCPRVEKLKKAFTVYVFLV